MLLGDGVASRSEMTAGLPLVLALLLLPKSVELLVDEVLWLPLLLPMELAKPEKGLSDAG